MNSTRRSRRPLLGAVLLGPLAALLLVACGDDGGSTTVELEITTQDWTGASREQPDPEPARTEQVGEGDDIEVDAVAGGLTITVVSIDDDEITVETSRAMAERDDDGGIDVRSDETEFTFDRDGEVSLTTPTLDAGTTVTIAER